MIRLCYENFALWADKRPILQPMSMTLEGPGVVALLGPSGVGKSSLLRATQHLITRSVDGWRRQGDITLDGESVFAMPNLARKIGFIHQKPRMLVGSVLDNVTFALKHSAKMKRGERRAVAERVIGQVGLLDEIESLAMPAANLSGGQAQRLAVARAVALEPEVLLMDEPCSALDPIRSRAMEDLIRTVAGDRLVLLVSHDPALVRRLADQAAFLMPDEVGARLIAEGATAEIFGSPPEPSVCEFIRDEDRGGCPLVRSLGEPVCAVCAPPGSLRSLLLFICDGNTSRSPMAEAICNQLQRLEPAVGLGALSAGLSPRGHKPLSAAAREALARRGVTAHDHRSRPVTDQLAARATAVYCMTGEQQGLLIERYPDEREKIHLLDPEGDIANPAKGDQHVYDQVLTRIEHAVRVRLDQHRERDRAEARERRSP